MRRDVTCVISTGSCAGDSEPDPEQWGMGKGECEGEGNGLLTRPHWAPCGSA